ncbi:hypothetical protein [Rhizohabitans arisaemae]|uniref:hypothetical protein n=1 Tax=Rhizohabitans arisaemae TaxID=2720610 RepID=UPI0024B1F216|nr:hypothetical protein [Rhizohabitans arisaemae]
MAFRIRHLGVAVAILAGSLSVSPAAQAQAYGNFVCEDGTRHRVSTLVPYVIWGTGCTGSGSGASRVVISSGPDAGVYQCREARVLQGTLLGQQC